MGAAGSEEFCLPDYRGFFLRGADMGRGADPDASSRIYHTENGGSEGGVVGSRQACATEKHEHFMGYVKPDFDELDKKIGDSDPMVKKALAEVKILWKYRVTEVPPTDTAGGSQYRNVLIRVEKAVNAVGESLLRKYGLMRVRNTPIRDFDELTRYIPPPLAAILNTGAEGTSAETRPANVYVNYIICFESFPGHDK